MIAEQIPEGRERRLAIEKIEQRLNPNEAKDGEQEMAKDWAGHEQSSREVSEGSAKQQWMASVAELWLNAGCAPKGAPHVVRALLARTDALFFPSSAPEVRKVAAAFLAKDFYAGAHGLLEDEMQDSKQSATALHRPRQNRDAKFRRNQTWLMFPA